MKKLMIALACASLSATAFAQDVTEVPTQKYSVATNSFWSNWFITVQGTYSSYKDAAANQGLLDTPLWGGSVALGKWFTPGLGLRAKVNAFQMKNMNFKSAADRHLKMWTGTLDVMFNVSNMLCGYNESRVWNVIPYFSAGVIRNCTQSNYGALIGGGLISTWKLGKHVNFNLEASLKGTGVGFAGLKKATSKSYTADAIFALEAGFTFNLGKATWNKVPDVDALIAANQAQLDALNAALAESQAENAKLREMLKNAPKDGGKTIIQEVKSFASVPTSVFFNIGKSKIASKKDLVNLEALADYAKANGCNLVVTGYADSATGSADLNQSLSEARAQAVADALVEMGVDSSKITTAAAGGVDTLSPASYNRRATVEVK